MILAPAGPLNCDQFPVPVVGALPAMVTLVEGKHIFCAGPATEVVGNPTAVNVTVCV